MSDHKLIMQEVRFAWNKLISNSPEALVGMGVADDNVSHECM